MISKKEIEDKSKELQINISNIQRDYLFGWLLHYIFTYSSFKDYLFLKGGNALRKGYFLQTRFSSDLDFGTPIDINRQSLEDEILKACEYIKEKATIEFIVERNSVNEKFSKWHEPRWQVYEVKMYFKDFHANVDHLTLKITLDVTRFDKTYLPLQKVELLHPYSDSQEIKTILRCMKLEEVIATKLKCLLQREHAPDLFDFIYSIYLNQDIQINKSEIRRVFLKRTIFDTNPSIAKRILLKLPLEILKAKWAKTIVYTESKLISAEEAISRFYQEISIMFSDVPDWSRDDNLYFGPELRNPILQAGKSLTLLKVIYDNVERLVEPYSLKFLEKTNGVAREYLYVYDRTGSKNNPGIKMFLPDKIQHIENTNFEFSPRDGHEVGLNRSSEYPENRYLYDPNKKTIRETSIKLRPKRTTSLGPKHQYKCSSCGKVLIRKERISTFDKAHKNPRGYSCYGYPIYLGLKF